MDYISATRYIDSFINFERIPRYQYASSFRLERMIAILEELGNPHKDLRVIHVAGSKGKGSTCAITAYILREAGYKVGLYTSPHLVDFRERIRVLCQKPEAFEGMIGGEEFVELVEEIRPIAEKFREHKTLGKVSFFEIITACAFLYFKKRQVDIAVLETGLGGRLDATNTAMPLVCGITNISLEHTDKLGNTPAEIAYEKAGIIKGGGWRVKGGGAVISAKQEKEAGDAIRKTCQEKGAKLYEVGKDIKYSIVSSDENRQVFDLEGPGYSYKGLELNLIGSHQAENASLGIGMLKLIGQYGFNIEENNIREGLKKTAWPGRMHLIQKDPYIILDGAQNPASMRTLVSAVKEAFNYKRLICVFGISSDKDIKGVSSILDIASDIIILTKAKENPRATDISELRANFRESRPGLEESGNTDEALQKALKLSNRDDLILVTGSLFIVGDTLKRLKTR